MCSKQTFHHVILVSLVKFLFLRLVQLESCYQQCRRLLLVVASTCDPQCCTLRLEAISVFG